jgi:hypothetical protein
LTLEPFRNQRRANLGVVRAGSSQQRIALLAHNTPGRADLVITGLQLSVPWVRCSQAFPVTIPAGQSRSLDLELDSESVTESEIRLTVLCNDIPRSYLPVGPACSRGSTL